MRKFSCFSFILVLVLCSKWALAAKVDMQNLRMWHAPEKTRVVFDVSGPLKYRISVLENPDRLAVYVDNAEFSGALPSGSATGPLISKVRTGAANANPYVFVFELRHRVQPKSFLLTPNEIYGHRLVVDLYRAAGPVTKKPTPPTPESPPSSSQSGPFIVAIDPGHGGEDPGAIGRRRTQEKKVVLEIAQRLYKKINATSGMRAVLTRSGDYYVSLRGRTKIAREKNANLFVSIHADAFKRSSARGSSVYALSRRGATSESARWLAQKENAADFAGGVKLGSHDELVRQVLVDLSMTKTVSESIVVAKDVLAEFKRIGPVHSSRVEQAGFVVLKSPDIPSILIETAYITNPKEEKQLRSRKHQERIADAILRGIQRYIARRPGRLNGVGSNSKSTGATPVRVDTYVVKPGDNLSAIARRFGVSVSALRKANGISGSGNVIFVGKKLRIP